MSNKEIMLLAAGLMAGAIGHIWWLKRKGCACNGGAGQLDADPFAWLRNMGQL